MTRWMPALALLALSTAMSATLVAAPRDPNLVAAVFPPWWSAERALSAAGAAGAILRTGAWPWIVVVTGPGDKIASVLHTAGALFLVDPTAAGLCGTPADLPA